MVIRALSFAVSLAIGAHAAATPLGIEKVQLDSIDPAILQQVEALTKQAVETSKTVRPEDVKWLEELAEKNRVIERDALAGTEPAQAPDSEKKHPLGEGNRTLIFVSWSMGATAIKDIMAEYDGRPATGIVFRGIPEGMKMIDAVTKMHMLTQETQSQVSVLLDPLAFQRHGIEFVPAIVLENEEDKSLAKASGTSSARLVDQAVTDGKPAGTDLGVQGPTSEIIEPDLLQVAKARIEALDTEAMKKRAIERFWHNHPGTPLPPALEPAIRYVDPSVIIPQDILDHSGNVVQKAGRINPLEMMPFNQKLVVIDPTQPWQVALAKREYQSHGASQVVTVMATQIPAASGWDLFEATENAIDAPLYLLKPDMAQRFQILKVPSVVTAEGLSFKVQEFTKDEVEGDQNES
jgi:conjugal transfer pilus assembly protein TraW